jgi:hypothetical protein
MEKERKRKRERETEKKTETKRDGYVFIQKMIYCKELVHSLWRLVTLKVVVWVNRWEIQVVFNDIT